MSLMPFSQPPWPPANSRQTPAQPPQHHLLTDLFMFWAGWTIHKHFAKQERRRTSRDLHVTDTTVVIRLSALEAYQELVTEVLERRPAILDSEISLRPGFEDFAVQIPLDRAREMLATLRWIVNSPVRLTPSESTRVNILYDLLSMALRATPSMSQDPPK